MDNPFYKRATEFLRDDQDFLAVITPEPVTRFLKAPAQAGYLFDRLVRIWGTPGSGKTTLARIFEYQALSTVFGDGGNPNHKELAAAMVECKAVYEGQPVLVGCRLPMETSYRDFWELPYPENIRFRLMASFLQAKAMLAWIRALTVTGVRLDGIALVPRAGSENRLASVGASGPELQQCARSVESAIYKVIGAVIAPQLEQLPEASKREYAPFDVIESIRIPSRSDDLEATHSLQPLVILDDTNYLHPSQFEQITRWLAARELRIGRWMLARFDVLKPEEAFGEDVAAPEGRQPGLTTARDVIEIRLQGSGSEENRTYQRRAFRSMVKDMANRYLGRISLFFESEDHGHYGNTEHGGPSLPPKRMAELRKDVDATQAELGINAERRSGLESEVERYASTRIGEDVRAAMLMILMQRHRKRAGGPSLFPGEDPEPARPVAANANVQESAELHLLHKYGRPYFFGADTLCDASSENAEQFLHLAAVLVDAVANQLTRSHHRTLNAARQNDLLRQRGEAIFRDKNFPYHLQAKRVAYAIGEHCRQETLEPNGWLRPNTYGVLQSEFNDAIASDRELAELFQFGMAYNAWSLKRNYSCQGKTWCLVELGGAIILQYGLSLGRGDFVKGTIAGLRRWANEPLKTLGTRR